MPLLEDNINANRGLYDSVIVRPAILDWSDDELPGIVAEHDGYHVIVYAYHHPRTRATPES